LAAKIPCRCDFEDAGTRDKVVALTIGSSGCRAPR
jgi:hypothetical protein